MRAKIEEKREKCRRSMIRRAKMSNSMHRQGGEGIMTKTKMPGRTGLKKCLFPRVNHGLTRLVCRSLPFAIHSFVRVCSFSLYYCGWFAWSTPPLLYHQPSVENCTFIQISSSNYPRFKELPANTIPSTYYLSDGLFNPSTIFPRFQNPNTQFIFMRAHGGDEEIKRACS